MPEEKSEEEKIISNIQYHYREEKQKT